jgi:glycine cleavage system aminomethyltransferase T
LWIDDHEAGVVTSVAHSPALAWIGLGYLKASEGVEARVVQSRCEDRMVSATVSALPMK